MTVHEGFRAQAVFLSTEEWHEGDPQPTPFGTAFFVGVHLNPDAPYTESHPRATYAVTAKHNIIDLPKTYPVYITLNRFGGGFKQITRRLDDWTCHPETDIAVCEVPTLEGVLHNAVSFAELAPKSPESAAPRTVQLGDSVFTIGVYSGIRGQRFQAIARFGRVSLLPNPREKIRVVITDEDKQKDYDDLPEIQAYLIEVRAWEGQSGSPVFVSYGRTESLDMVMSLVEPKIVLGEEGIELEPPPFKVPTAMVFRPKPVCIGLIQGYHPDTMDTFVPDYKYLVNLGIAIVVPSSAIIETLMMPELVAERERKRAQLGILPSDN